MRAVFAAVCCLGVVLYFGMAGERDEFVSSVTVKDVVFLDETLAVTDDTDKEQRSPTEGKVGVCIVGNALTFWNNRRLFLENVVNAIQPMQRHRKVFFDLDVEAREPCDEEWRSGLAVSMCGASNTTTSDDARFDTAKLEEIDFKQMIGETVAVTKNVITCSDGTHDELSCCKVVPTALEANPAAGGLLGFKRVMRKYDCLRLIQEVDAHAQGKIDYFVVVHADRPLHTKLPSIAELLENKSELVLSRELLVGGDRSIGDALIMGPRAALDKALGVLLDVFDKHCEAETATAESLTSETSTLRIAPEVRMERLLAETSFPYKLRNIGE